MYESIFQLSLAPAFRCLFVDRDGTFRMLIGLINDAHQEGARDHSQTPKRHGLLVFMLNKLCMSLAFIFLGEIIVLFPQCIVYIKNIPFVNMNMGL